MGVAICESCAKNLGPLGSCDRSLGKGTGSHLGIGWWMERIDLLEVNLFLHLGSPKLTK